MHILKNLAATLKNGFRTFMPTCQRVGRLQSAGLDQPQSFSKRLGLRLHLLVCKWCRRYGRQICFLREAAHQHSDELTQATPASLSSEARERLRRSLRDESG